MTYAFSIIQKQEEEKRRLTYEQENLGRVGAHAGLCYDDVKRDGMYGLWHRQRRDGGRFDDGDTHLRLDER